MYSKKKKKKKDGCEKEGERRPCPLKDGESVKNTIIGEAQRKYMRKMGKGLQ
jgi:hypothetical protein